MNSNNRSRGAGDQQTTAKSQEASGAGIAGAEPIVKIGSILADAYWQCAASGMRFGWAATGILTRGQLRLLEHMRQSGSEPLGDHALRTAVDEARGCLREVADAAFSELGQLRSGLAALQQTTRDLASEPDSGEETYKRRWKAKE